MIITEEIAILGKTIKGIKRHSLYDFIKIIFDDGSYCYCYMGYNRREDKTTFEVVDDGVDLTMLETEKESNWE